MRSFATAALSCYSVIPASPSLIIRVRYAVAVQGLRTACAELRGSASSAAALSALRDRLSSDLERIGAQEARLNQQYAGQIGASQEARCVAVVYGDMR